jgi:tRNA pseudouridine38-40 synthase
LNFKITLQYDGTDFHGWQMQGELRTVQGELTRALSLIEGKEVVVHGSGRTDAGVHAEGQVAIVVLEKPITAYKLRAAINGNVERDLRAIQVEEVGDDFHARYSAIGKTYRYRIVNDSVVSPFWVRYAHHDARPLNIQAMIEAAELFLGEHDWTAFSAAQSEVEDRVRTITELNVREMNDDKLIEIEAIGNGFLRYMVRSIAGTLMAAGRGELNKREIQAAIESGVRPKQAVTAPAHGLTLVSVNY